MTPDHIGYVVTPSGMILAQVPDDGPWGFALYDGRTAWTGGVMAASSWTVLADDDPRIGPLERERYQRGIDRARAERGGDGG